MGCHVGQLESNLWGTGLGMESGDSIQPALQDAGSRRPGQTGCRLRARLGAPWSPSHQPCVFPLNLKMGVYQRLIFLLSLFLKT